MTSFRNETYIFIASNVVRHANGEILIDGE
jgi:hypothetical protein